MPTGIPGVGQQAWRIDLDNFAVVFESLARALESASKEAPLAAGTRVDFKLRHFESLVATPLQGLIAVNQGLEDALGRGGDFDLADDRVLVGSDYGFGFDGHFLLHSLSNIFSKIPALRFRSGRAFRQRTRETQAQEQRQGQRQEQEQQRRT